MKLKKVLTIIVVSLLVVACGPSKSEQVSKLDAMNVHPRVQAYIMAKDNSATIVRSLEKSALKDVRDYETMILNDLGPKAKKPVKR